MANVTIKDIAKKVGVSYSAVSMALRDHPRISKERREQIKTLARKMGYQPDLVARSLRAQKSNTIGMVISDFRKAAHNLKAEAVEKFLEKRGYQVMLGFSGGQGAKISKYVNNMLGRQVDGFIVADIYPDPIWEKLENSLLELSVPCVLVDYCNFETELPGVFVDRAAGMASLGEHLSELGHRDVVYVTTEAGSWLSGQAKWDGVCKGLKNGESEFMRLRYALARNKGWFEVDASGEVIGLSESTFDGKFDSNDLRIDAAIAYEKGREIAKWRDRPTAIVASSDTHAMCIIQGLMAEGVKVPEDISVTGFDDLDEASFFRPLLTTLRQPREELAEVAGEMLIKLLEGEELEQNQVWLKPKLMIRESSGPARVKLN